MVLVHYLFLILLITFTSVMNDPEFVPRFNYYSVNKNEDVNSVEITNENRGIKILQILSKESVVVFEMVREDGFCRVFMWFGKNSEHHQRKIAVSLAAELIVNITELLICETFRVVREIPGFETDDFKETLNIQPLSFPPRRLYVVKGEENVVIKQVSPYLTKSSMNDVFVLHSERGIHMIIGINASKKTEDVAFELVQHIVKNDIIDYKSATQGKIIDLKAMHKQGISFREYEELVTIISMIYNGKEDFWGNSTGEIHQNENLEYGNERYSNVKLEMYSNTDGKASLIENFSFRELIQDDNSTYLLKDEESLRIAFVYIGENSTKIAIESAFLEAEKLNYEESYEIKVIQKEYIHTQFIISFKDYEEFLGFNY